MEDNKKIYLAGGISGLSYSEARSWRTRAKELLRPEFEGIDPLDKEELIINLLYEGKGKPRKETSIEVYPPWACKYIIEKDLHQIGSSVAMIVNICRPSWGTAMEIFYTSEVLKRPIFAFGNSKERSPWIQFHVVVLVDTVEGAVKAVKDAMGVGGWGEIKC